MLCNENEPKVYPFKEPEYSLYDYYMAPSGIGPLAQEFQDKPHRLLYDLINLVKFYREQI